MSDSLLMKAVRSLNFRQDCRAELNFVDPDRWPALLKQTDHSQLTLPLGVRCRDYLPALVRSRIDLNLSANVVRHQLLDAEYRLISDTFRARSINFTVRYRPVLPARRTR